MASSGTTNYNPTIAEVAIECFDRMQIRPTAITPDHLKSAYRSMNLIQSKWENLGINLWAVTLESELLVQGIGTISVPSNTVNVLDTYVRLYNMNQPTDVDPDFSATSADTEITVVQADHGLVSGQYLAIVIPVSVGGLILQGFYQCQTVPSINSYTITAASAATSTVPNGGAVPVFTTTGGLSTVSVAFANHGYSAGELFTVQVAVQLGGITLFGPYTIDSVTSANAFVIATNFVAGSTDTESENDGDTQIATQNTTADPTDRLMYPLSRNDFAAIPNKYQQGVPNTFWYDRTLEQTLNIWLVPDGNGPYELRYYRTVRIEDTNVLASQTIDIPNRFMEAYHADVTAHLSSKWMPTMAVALKGYADEQWQIASKEDREKTSSFIAPDLSGYL